MAQTIRGFRDILEPDAAAFSELENLCRRIFRLYGYSEIRLPTVEQRELFVKSTGDTTDIVEKEMYAFADAGGRLLALRPEGTPGVVRAYMENGLPATDQRRKLFYIGSMFRAERPQAGRYREFEQIGAEYIGNPDPSADAETILLLAELLKAAGIREMKLELNSIGCPQCRPAHRQALLDYLKDHLEELCENCKKRLERNPLRALDCKADGPKLVAQAPAMKYCPDCDAHFAQVRRHLDNAGQAYNINPNLVRGLDYYSRTVFEFRAGGIGSQDAIAAGGRYDSLIKSMGGPDVAAVGWALGADRVLVGAYQDDTGAYNAGAVYLFSTNGTLLTTLTNPAREAGDCFGRSVAALGTDRVLVGADSDDLPGSFDAGAAYLFGTDGALLATFTKPEPAAQDYFGYSLTTVGTGRVL
ncbi:MAG TPA: histidine--tRNA ligase, partial [Elusimicrobiales bacterium]|nr:histidine--tRNA ligase [Elusimicrobiales bacterium]